jgi:hypothetical protein
MVMSHLRPRRLPEVGDRAEHLTCDVDLHKARHTGAEHHAVAGSQEGQPNLGLLMYILCQR